MVIPSTLIPSGSEQKSRCGWIAAMLLFLLLVAALPIYADYRFQVPENRVLVEVNTDASITIHYSITFKNQGQPIDIIDVGMPDKNYRDVRADLDGVSMTDIRKSEVLASGVEVHLHAKTIQPGSVGTLHLSARAFNRVFPDSKDKTYASVVFSPTWYGAKYTSGTTHLVCEFLFPAGVGLNDPRYHKTPYNSETTRNGRIVYTWDLPSASPSRRYTFGASFPVRVMKHVAAAPKRPGLAARFGTGVVRTLFKSPPCCFFIFVLLIMIFGGLKARKRRMKYLPPSVGMEGVEVRRGLTVPEVAVLMEKPVNEVLAFILFGMVKKGLVTIKNRSPLLLEPVKEKTAEKDYEKAFLKAVSDDGRVDEDEAAKMLTDLIKRVQDKMKGFSRKKSLLYYREIMRKAWEKVGKDDYSDAFEWLILDKNFAGKARSRYASSPMPLPVWWAPMYTGHDLSHATTPTGAPLPNPVASANSIVSGLESFGNSLVNSVPGLASKVTAKTNPVPKSSGGHSGGGCACACAGCACACAGGGR